MNPLGNAAFNGSITSPASDDDRLVWAG